MSPNVIRLEPVPSPADDREASGLRSSSTVHPTVAAYSRANSAGLFALASSRAQITRQLDQTAKAEVQRAAEPRNLSLTIATGLALATLVPVALRQFKVLRRLPDLDHHLFNSNRVVTSRKSRYFGIPDSALGVGSYSATLALVLLAPKFPVARKLVGPKLALDSTIAVANTVRQFTSFEKLCSWCLLTVAATAAMAITGRKELRRPLM